MNDTEQAIIDRWVTQRDAEAFQQLVARYSSMVYATCRRVIGDPTDAEDIAQECFEALAQTRRVPRGYVGPWLHRVAVRRSLNHVRGAARRRSREDVFREENPTLTRPEWDDLYQYVDQAIADLPERLRIPVIAHFLEGQTHEAVAERFGIPRQTATYRIRTGIERIRKALRKKGIEVGGPALAVMLAANAAEAAPVVLTATLGKIALAGVSVTSTGIAGVLAGAVGAVATKYVIAFAAVAAIAAGAVYHVEDASQQSAPTVKANVTYTSLIASTSNATEPSDSQASTSGHRSAAPTEPVTGIAPGTGSVTGRVYEEETGTPISDTLMLIETYSKAGGQFPAVTTDAEGRYRFNAIPPGDYRVSHSIWGLVGPQQRESVKVAVKADYLVEGVDFPIFVEAPVSGKVVNATADPVDRARVLAESTRGSAFYMTGPDGRFLLRGLRAGDTVTLSAVRREDPPGTGLTSAEYGSIAVPAGGLSGIEIVLASGSVLSGKVVDTQGRPVRDALVNLSAWENGASPQQVWNPGTTDATGSFKITCVPPRTYELIILPNYSQIDASPGRAYIEAAPPWDTVDVEPGKNIDGITAVLDLKLSISGRVLNSTGNPVPDAWVMCSNGINAKSASTDKEGNYTVYNLVEGVYTVKVERVQEMPIPQDLPESKVENVPAGSTGIDLRAEADAPAIIEGTVISEETGSPIPQFELLVLDGANHNSPWTGRPFKAYADNDGVFRVDNVTPGPVTVVARAQGFVEAVETLPDIRAGSTPTQVALRMRTGSTVNGIVQDEQGSPVAMAYVFAGAVPYMERPEQVAVAQSAADGTFQAAGLSPGVSSLSALASGYASGTTPVSVTAKPEQPVVIVLSRGGTIEGRVFYDGRPWPGQRVSASGPRVGNDSSVTTGATGGFRFEGV
ncbi:MAG: sigma-70 family RNA polymerase sigma factor, partial [Candidatus Hydrogenedentales bacterium]